MCVCVCEWRIKKAHAQSLLANLKQNSINIVQEILFKSSIKVYLINFLRRTTSSDVFAGHPCKRLAKLEPNFINIGKKCTIKSTISKVKFICNDNRRRIRVVLTNNYMKTRVPVLTNLSATLLKSTAKQKCIPMTHNK